MAVCLGAGSQVTVRRWGDPSSCLCCAVSHMTGAHISPGPVAAHRMCNCLDRCELAKFRNRPNVVGILLDCRVAAPTMRAWYRRKQGQISQMQFPVLRPGWDDGDFGSNFSPDTRAIPLCRTASTEVSADRPETSVAACPWSSPA